jgi:putative Ca2+/H+ antiporter (TMEM165/GDT1 family)
VNLGAMLATFALVIPAELPDKTFISCIVMASRHRPIAVWIGGATALILQAAIAVVAGRLLTLLPQTAVRSVIAALFIAGAAYLLFVPERRETERGEELAKAEEVQEGGDAPVEGTASTVRAFWKPMLATFGILALAEFGDITQILIANLSARFRDPWAVFIGASAAFVVVSGFGVVGGRAIVRVVPLSVVRRLSGLALLGLGIYTIVELL